MDMGCKSVEAVVMLTVILLASGCGNKLENKSEKQLLPLTAEQQLVQMKQHLQEYSPLNVLAESESST